MLAAGKPHASQRQSQRPPQRPLTDTLTRRYKDEKGHEREEAVALEGYSRREVREEYTLWTPSVRLDPQCAWVDRDLHSGLELF